jgi:hypothetical protein
MNICIRTLTGAVATTLVGASLALGSTPALADDAPSASATTLDYTCTFPLVGPRPVEVQITTNLPERLAAGEETPTVEVETIATVDSLAAEGLSTVGAATLSGTAHASAILHQPGGSKLNLEVPAEIAETPVPASGSFTTDATASLFPIVFDRPGTARVTVGNLVLTITPRDHDGRTTGLDTFHTDCELLPGQEDTVAVVEVVEDGPEEPNNPPTAGNIWRIVEGNQPTVLDLPVTDPDGDELTVEVSAPTSGSVEVDGTTVTFTPAKPGKAGFTYAVSDGRGGEASGKVDLIVKGDGQAWWAWVWFGWFFEQNGQPPLLTW